jgi:glycosyltransferase involved in cell wall biosynthesis
MTAYRDHHVLPADGLSEAPALSPPQCSVLIATYRSEYLVETLRSVLRQVQVDIEIIVLDDANDDDCRRSVAALGDDRVIYVSHEKPLGPALNHAHGIELARGRYVAIVNHDDVVEPEFLRRLSSELEAYPSANAAFSRPRVIDGSGEFNQALTDRAWRNWGVASLTPGLIVSWSQVGPRPGFPFIPSGLFRTDAIKKVKIPRIVGGAYDYWIAYRVARNAPVIHVDEALGYWREHPGNLTGKRSWRTSMEGLYIDARIFVDRQLPWRSRAAAIARLPRTLASTIKSAIRDLTTSRTKG